MTTASIHASLGMTSTGPRRPSAFRARRRGPHSSTSARAASMTSGIAPSRRRSPSAAIVCLEPTPVSSAWYRSTRTRAWGRDSWGCSPRGQQARCCQPVVNSDEAPGAQHVQVVPSGVDVSAKPVRMRGAEGLHADRRGLAPHGCPPPGRRRVPARLYGSMEIVESPARTKASRRCADGRAGWAPRRRGAHGRQLPCR